MRGADLRFAKNLTEKQLACAILYETTTSPDGSMFQPPGNET
jgi:hypothetical protein